MKEYIEVRKVKWDALWHAKYKTKDIGSYTSRITYDRVTQKEAIKISKSL